MSLEIISTEEAAVLATDKWPTAKTYQEEAFAAVDVATETVAWKVARKESYSAAWDATFNATKYATGNAIFEAGLGKTR